MCCNKIILKIDILIQILFVDITRYLVYSVNSHVAGSFQFHHLEGLRKEILQSLHDHFAYKSAWRRRDGALVTWPLGVLL